MELELSNDLSLALKLADIADAITLHWFNKSIGWIQKNDGSPVSKVDCDVEESLIKEILIARPNDRILGEENTYEQTAQVLFEPKQRCWIIDPIDQTRHYIRGNPEFATLISLEIGGQICVSVVTAPALGMRWWATRGQGAWKNNEKILVSEITKLEEAYLTIAGHREWHNQWNWAKLASLLDSCNYPAGCPGGFLQQMLVAEGAIDVFLEPWGEIWDHAGPSLIVEEAGGLVSTLLGFPPRGGSLLATNGTLHEVVRQYIEAN